METHSDVALQEVFAELKALDPDGQRMANVFRETFDQLYNGQHTGRYKVDQLFKTEKTHFGTLIEINLQREFKFEDGDVLDYKIAGHEVDCKYSHTGQWMLPLESFDQLVLVTRANDIDSTWSAGVVRVTEKNRRTSQNRDKKTSLNTTGRANIHWLRENAPLPPNALLQVESAVVTEIMEGSSGQKRVNQLFRSTQNYRISRTIVATVAQQSDYMKRVRDNGGARQALRDEGIIILSGDYRRQQQIARDLGGVEPREGEFVSLRVVPTSHEEGVLIDGGWWRLALPDEESTAPAPEVK